MERRRDALISRISAETKRREAPHEELRRVEAELEAVRREQIPELDARDRKTMEATWQRAREIQTRILARLRDLDADFAELAAERDRWLGTRLAIAERHGPLSPNARFYLRNEAHLGKIGGTLPEGVSEGSIVLLRDLLGVIVASFHAHPDVPVNFGKKKAKPDPRIRRRYETLVDGRIQIL